MVTAKSEYIRRLEAEQAIRRGRYFSNRENAPMAMALVADKVGNWQHSLYSDDMAGINGKYEISAEFKYVEENDFDGDALADLDFDLVLNWSGSRLTGTAIVPAFSQELAFARFQLSTSRTGLKIAKLDLGLVSISDIAEDLDVSRETVRMWAEGKRRKDFPTPIAQVGGSNIWAWSDVYVWAATHFASKIPDYRPISIEYTQFVNGALFNSHVADEHEAEFFRALGYDPDLATKWHLTHRFPAPGNCLQAEPKRFVS